MSKDAVLMGPGRLGWRRGKGVDQISGEVLQQIVYAADSRGGVLVSAQMV